MIKSIYASGLQQAVAYDKMSHLIDYSSELTIMHNVAITTPKPLAEHGGLTETGAADVLAAEAANRKSVEQLLASLGTPVDEQTEAVVGDTPYEGITREG